MPFIAQVAVGRRPKVTVFGSDYDTPDGTGVRDYIHIMDIADGHVVAVKHILRPECLGTNIFNLGTGGGKLNNTFQKRNINLGLEIGTRSKVSLYVDRWTFLFNLSSNKIFRCVCTGCHQGIRKSFRHKNSI